MSTAQYVTLVLDLADARGVVPQSGSVIIVPSGQIPDPNDQMLVGQEPVAVNLATSSSSPASVRLVSTDSIGPQPNGWTYSVSYVGALATAYQSFSFHLPFASGATQYLSALAQVPAALPGLSYLPLPSGAATAGYVPIATGSGEASAWGPQSVTSVFGRTGAVVASNGDYTAAQTGALAAKNGTTNVPAAQLAPQVVALVDAATVTPNLASGNDFRLALTSAIGATRAIANPQNLTDGQQVTFVFTQPASGGPCTVTWGTAYDFGSGSPPTLTTTASKGDVLGFKVVGSALWFLGSGPGSGY